MFNQPCAMPKLTRKQKARHWARQQVKAARFALHGAVWRALHFVRLGRPVSRLMCRMGVYRQYQPGVCGWCGKRHVKVSKKWLTHPMLAYDERGQLVFAKTVTDA